jgi:hypothetical protein
MAIRKILRLLGSAMLITVASAAQAEYTWINLESPPGFNEAIPNGICGTNIVGTYRDAGNQIHGFLYNGSTWTTLDYPGAFFGTEAFGISGTNIVGFYYTDATHGFLYDGITWKTLDDPLADLSQIYNGTYPEGVCGTNIVGQYNDFNDHLHGFLYNGSTWSTLDDPLGVTVLEGVSGTNIVGEYLETNNFQHAVLYNGNNWTTLDAPLGINGTSAYGVDATNIVGFYKDVKTQIHGFLYHGGNWITLDYPYAGASTNIATFLAGISGPNMVGSCFNSNSFVNGFIATPPPLLAINVLGNRPKLFWPYNPLIGWTLQQSSDLSQTNWTTVPGPIANDGTNNFNTFTPSSGRIYFRLTVP